MAEQIAFSILENVAQKVVDPILRQFSYLFCYKSNIKSLTDGVQDLQNKRDGVKLSVDAAKRNLEKIGPDVEAWLGHVEEVERKAHEVVGGTHLVKNGCLNGWFPNLKQRYLQSRKAVKQTVVVSELQKEGEKHTKLSYPALPAGMVASTSTVGFEVFESRKSKTKEIVEALKNETISKIGICGLGGVGKTRMVKEIRDKAKAENLFDAVAMAVVSQNQDLEKIQDQLASMLGLKLDEKNSIDERGKRLRESLTEANRTLVILDDVWKQIDFGELGIPVGGQGDRKGCKVLLTSRDEHVCNSMDTQINFTIQLLSDQEAWALFKEKVGDCVENADLRSLAKEVVNECGRLPLAIVTVGTALKGRGMDVWKDALGQLKRSTVTSIEGMERNVYSSLRLSYDYLGGNQSSTEKKESNQHQRLFLLCCLFPEDSDIPIDRLVRYSMGLRLFEDIQELVVCRTRVQSLAAQLQSCYLLLPSDREGHVKMHDVVRDFGLKEASSGEHVYLVRNDAELKVLLQNDIVKPCTAISIESKEMLMLPPGLDCPKIQLLQLSTKGSIQISRDKFGGMKELRVVSFEGQFIDFDSEQMLLDNQPKALQFFTNVRTLCLEGCYFSSNICLIGSMQRLEILSFYGSKIDVLPSEIAQLSNLKLLDLGSCKVGLIPSCVLSCLSELEDLYMGDYFHGRGVEKRNQGQCASITELLSLSRLKTLQLSVSEPELVLIKLKGFTFEGLTRFCISIDEIYTNYSGYEFSNEVVLRKVDVGLVSEFKLNALIRRTKLLTLFYVKGLKYLVNESDEDGFMNLKNLHIDNNDDLIEICRGNLPVGSMCNLEKVVLLNAGAMRHLWRGQVQSPCLVNLKVLEIECCNVISLFSPSVVRCLVQLQKLRIYRCLMLQEIVSRDGAEDDDNNNKGAEMIEFPKLNDLHLNYTSLRSFFPISQILSSGAGNNLDGPFFNGVSMPSMETLYFNNIMVVQLVGGQMQPGSLYKLRVLELHQSFELRCVAAFEAIKLLVNLQKLQVSHCYSMETLFDFEGLEFSEEHAAEVTMLGQLDSIDIWVLLELRCLWNKVPKGIQVFQKLTELSVHQCCKLRFLFSPSVARMLMNLQNLRFGHCEIMEVVIQKEEEECCSEIENTDKIVFPRLLSLTLRNLENLTAFCGGNHDIEFPLLEKVSIFDKCPKMNNFCSGSLTTPKLESVSFEDESVWMGNLNNTIRHINERQRSVAPEIK
ncbi:hypothetical protein LguiB_004340 [Lonicera macranthoides]